MNEHRLSALLGSCEQLSLSANAYRKDRQLRDEGSKAPITVPPGTRIERVDLSGFIVYQLFDSQDLLLYVGQTIDLAHRLGFHYRDSHFGHRIHHITYEQVATYRQMMDLEAQLIRQHQPPHNTVGNNRPRKLGIDSPSVAIVDRNGGESLLSVQVGP